MKETPMMLQYKRIKSKYPDCILFFRLGDFYEMFGEDAEIASSILEIALTKRNNEKMCGIPFHAADSYIHKLIKAGKKIAICEQIEEPSRNKIVERKVVEIITPSTFFDETKINSRKDSFLVAISIIEDNAGICCIDATSGKFFVIDTKNNPESLKSTLRLISPAEIILHTRYETLDKIIDDYYYTIVPDYYFNPSLNEVFLLNHFNAGTLKGLGLDKEFLLGPVAAALKYLKNNLAKDISYIKDFKIIKDGDYLYLNDSTINNLEIFEPQFTTSKDTSLFSNINLTLSPMGGRLLRNYLTYPLKDKKKIEERLDKVEFFVNHKDILNKIRSVMLRFDLERLFGRVMLKKVKNMDIIKLSEGFSVIENIKSYYKPDIEVGTLLPIIDRINSTISDNADNEGVIKKGVNKELDEYKDIARNSMRYILKIEDEERKRTGINTLKIGYNKIIGYYIEVTKVNLDKVPKNYIRKHSLVNAERFTIPELIEYETKIEEANSKIEEIEKKIFDDLLDYLISNYEVIKSNIEFIKELDLYTSLALLAIERNYVRPIIDDKIVIDIRDGRHPVVEMFVDNFCSNSLYMDEEKRFIILTGPNMAGKSTYIRQAALIVLLSHIGSFVPASYARIGIFDQIFTRIGASDNIAEGESTFLVEMTEAATILRNATERTLIIMDEVGRGTSTYDGLSIAWSIVEYLTEENRGLTLFATHYHELTKLDTITVVRNYRMAVKEFENDVVFLHKVEEGAADKSYGIHVAQIAGLPDKIIKRATEILSSIQMIMDKEEKIIKKKYELNLFEQDNLSYYEPIISKIKAIDINHTTPLQALVFLNKIQEELKKIKSK
ncbi:MAG TPA: DNA mismatch repair protein MutS [Spirochaetota bacterium]|nr:DNA mismatch repair protein MutS [Spirochaetota bacterium]HOM38076.1 DNA mismatch repair protein MutS [Spirochaetota bacterium]HPQ48879.1 DNA mismatch repair protein MutS [Spirochaetota bacterium]